MKRGLFNLLALLSLLSLMLCMAVIDRVIDPGCNHRRAARIERPFQRL